MQGWLLYQDAQTWHCRPSDLLSIQDDYVAYCVDTAVAYLGRAIQAELDGVEAKSKADGIAKRKIILARFFGTDDKPVKGVFADPAASIVR